MKYHSFLSNEDATWGEREVIRFRWILISAILVLIAYIFISGNTERGFISLAIALVYIFYNSIINILLVKYDNASWIRYLSSTIDVTILSVHIFNYSCFFSPIAISTAASIFLYAILIMLSVLRYDGRLVIYTTAYTILCYNIIFFIRFPKIDTELIEQVASAGRDGVFFRSVYFILMGYFMFSIPKMINRLVDRQNTVNKERREIEIKLMLETQRREMAMQNLLLEQQLSEQLNQQKQLIEEQNQELEKLVSVKNKLFSIIGHDLRSPLCIQSSLSEYLIHDFNDVNKEMILKNLYAIHKTANNGLNILSNLINWSQSQDNMLTPNPKNVSVKSKIDCVIDQQSEEWKRKELQIKASINNSIRTYVDDHMFETVLRNLFSNAIKFTFNKGQIEFSAYNENKKCIIKITDNGVGMNEHQINNLFSFANTTSSMGTNNEKGTGLGLILCKEMIDKNNGQIEVLSTPNKGTQFIITLP